MILGFNKQFVDKILCGKKIHTIRQDKNNRWQQGRLIHFSTGVRTKEYNRFMVGVCTNVQKIEIKYSIDGGIPDIFIDDKILSIEDMSRLAHCDGFNCLYDFLVWFDQDFSGKIIHWTDFKYGSNNEN